MLLKCPADPVAEYLATGFFVIRSWGRPSLACSRFFWPWTYLQTPGFESKLTEGNSHGRKENHREGMSKRRVEKYVFGPGFFGEIDERTGEFDLIDFTSPRLLKKLPPAFEEEWPDYESLEESS